MPTLTIYDHRHTPALTTTLTFQTAQEIKQFCEQAARSCEGQRSGVVVYVPSADGTEGGRITVYPAREAA